MPINDLSKSLINSVMEICTRSSDNYAKLTKKVVAEGLKHFNVSNISELSQGQQKAFHAWTQLRLNESSCGCGPAVDEDDMPGDAPFHKDGDEDAEKKNNLGEEDDLELAESIALDADEIATNGAVGVTNAEEQLPVHVDVIRDSNPLTGTTQFRLFAQFNTNTLPQIVPPVVLPGAPTLDALRDVVEGLPWYCDECARALADAADVPHQRPEHSGVVSEALTLSQTDRLFVATIKRILKTTDVTVLYNNTEYLARIPSKDPGNFYHLGIILEPSNKRLGKQNWVIYDQTISDQDPTSGQKLASPLQSLPFDPGDIAFSVRKLQEVLQQAAKGVASGSYAAQETTY